MGITATLSEPLYTGGSVASQGLVPYVWDVAIDGVPYAIDWNKTGSQYEYHHETKPLLRNQADQSDTPGEHSLTADGLWRRAIETWHAGAGQSYFDRPDSETGRFFQSKGIDPWTKWQMSLLHDTDQRHISVNSNLFLVMAGTRLYFSDGQSLRYTDDLLGVATVTGTHASTIQAVAADGFNVYAAWSNGIGRTDTGTGAVTTAWNALTASVLGYVKGRLMAAGTGANSHKLYNVTASGAAPAALFTAGNASFTWVGFAEGPSAIYAAGYVGDKSLIYRIGVTTDGTALDAPVVAGELPDGEIVRSIQGYLGFVMLGTDKGVRFAIPNADGDLTIGARIDTDSPVLCFEPQDRFVWFGWSGYDENSTGLGRLDLQTINAGTTPAYASDLMADATGAVVSVASFGVFRVFSVAGSGLWVDNDELVASGYIDSGYITYQLPEDKILAAVDVRHEAIAADFSNGQHSAELTTDRITYAGIGAHIAGDTLGEQFVTGNTSGETLEIRHTLVRGTDPTLGPTIRRMTLKVLPRANTPRSIQVPLILNTDQAPIDATQQRDTNADVAQIAALRAAQSIVQYQEFLITYQVVVEEFIVVPEKAARFGKYPVGTLVVRLKTIDF